MVRLQDIIGITKFGLENLDTLSKGSKNFSVIDVFIINEDTLCCNFYSDSANSMDIKMEIATIMGFFNGFFRNDGFEGISPLFGMLRRASRSLDKSEFLIL